MIIIFKAQEIEEQSMSKKALRTGISQMQKIEIESYNRLEF